MTERDENAPDAEPGPPDPDADLAPEPEDATELAADIDEATDAEIEADEGLAEAAMDDANFERDSVPVEAAGAAGAGAIAGRGGRVVAGAAPGATAGVPDRAIHINDRASKVFVLLAAVAFAVILLNGMLFGVGGAFTPYVSPSPSPSPSPSVSASPSSSASPSPSSSASPAASGSAAPSVSASPAPSS